MKAVFVFLLLFVNKSNAQTQTLKVHHIQCIYSTLFNKYFDAGQKFISFESTLYISGEKSVFFSLPTIYETKEQIDNNIYIDISTDTLFKVIKYSDKEFMKFKDNTFSKKGKFFSDTLYPMKWTLIDEFKMLDSMKCYQAKTYFKGRNYIVWYCPQITITNGPWKLGGLPGLIVEAYDETKQLYFRIKSLKEIEVAKLEQQLVGEANINNLPNYQDYIKSGTDYMKNLLGQLSANSSEKCVNCQTTSKIKINNWENVIH